MTEQQTAVALRGSRVVTETATDLTALCTTRVAGGPQLVLQLHMDGSVVCTITPRVLVVEA
jgi:hypothetical protein